MRFDDFVLALILLTIVGLVIVLVVGVAQAIA